MPSLRQNCSGLRTNCVTTTPFLFTLHWVFSQSLPTTEIRLSRLPMLLRNTQSRHPINKSSKDLLGLINWATLNYIHWANFWIRNVQVDINYFSLATTKALKHILVVRVTLWGRSYFVQGRSKRLSFIVKRSLAEAARNIWMSVFSVGFLLELF